MRMLSMRGRQRMTASTAPWIFVLPFLLLFRQSLAHSSSRRWLPRERGRGSSSAKIFQPAVITTIEQHPATKVVGSISQAEGTPWCDGRPTYWLVGHQSDEKPWCLADNGTWNNAPNRAVMDNLWIDPLIPAGMKGHHKWIDRHDCVAMDVNRDGRPDIICLNGADHGKGSGYTEVYLTQPNGSLEKMVSGHGLHKFPSMRTRLAAKLKGGLDGDEQFVFIGTLNVKRDDGLPNQPRMFKNIYQEVNGTVLPRFEEVPGPWIQYFLLTCVLSADINGDGMDDLILGSRRGLPLIILQTDGTWTRVNALIPPAFGSWQNVRVSDVTGDGVPDLITASYGEPSFVRIFEGIREEPFFKFSKPFYQRSMKYTTPDLEVLDVNLDGIPDIYVVQVSRARGTYCGYMNERAQNFWGGATFPNASWTPPNDVAHDVLLVGRISHGTGKLTFRPETMDHSLPGCGGLVEKFGSMQRMILAQGDMPHAGHNLLLEW